MRKEDIETGFIVKAVFRKYGNHIIVGEVIEICTNEHALDGDWAGIRVTGGDTEDKRVRWMLEKRICCLIPCRDIKEIVYK